MLTDSDFLLANSITELARSIRKANKEKGFEFSNSHEGFLSAIALVHSELSECVEFVRKIKEPFLDTDFGNLASISRETIIRVNKNLDEYKVCFEDEIKDTAADELADAIIRILDITGYYGIDIGKHIIMKLEYNKLRPHKHGKEV